MTVAYKTERNVFFFSSAFFTWIYHRNYNSSSSPSYRVKRGLSFARQKAEYIKRARWLATHTHIHAPLVGYTSEGRKLSTILHQSDRFLLLGFFFFSFFFTFFLFVVLFFLHISNNNYTLFIDNPCLSFFSFSSSSRSTRSSMHEHRHQQQTQFFSPSTFLSFFCFLFFYLNDVIGNCKREAILSVSSTRCTHTRTYMWTTDWTIYIRHVCIYTHMVVRSNFIRGHEGCVTW